MLVLPYLLSKIARDSTRTPCHGLLHRWETTRLTEFPCKSAQTSSQYLVERTLAMMDPPLQSGWTTTRYNILTPLETQEQSGSSLTSSHSTMTLSWAAVPWFMMTRCG